jgi:demethylmenaquinone methyltransferase/2-methoxy-6-polyprenyl-1,4-benzoquinol methylase
VLNLIGFSGIQFLNGAIYLMDKFSLVIKSMFDRISVRYDFMNRFLTGGLDIYWRKVFVNQTLAAFIKLSHDKNNNSAVNIADIASGTGDIAIEIYNRIKTDNKTRSFFNDKTIHIYCSDFSLPMLKIAQEKIRKLISGAGGNKNINFSFVICDAQNSCFKDSTFDIVFIAFGLRNFSDIKKFISTELKRIVKKNLSLSSILEFNNIFKIKSFKVFQFYYNYIITLCASIFSTDTSAYKYLIDSIKNLPGDRIILKLFTDEGFKIFNYRKIFPYLVSRYIAIINNS